MLRTFLHSHTKMRLFSKLLTDRRAFLKMDKDSKPQNTRQTLIGAVMFAWELTVVGEPFVEVDLFGGKRHQIFQVEVHDPQFCVLWLHVVLLLFSGWFLSIGLRFGFPAREEGRVKKRRIE